MTADWLEDLIFSTTMIKHIAKTMLEWLSDKSQNAVRSPGKSQSYTQWKKAVHRHSHPT